MNIAVITGGYSDEKTISFGSADNIISSLKTTSWNIHKVIIEKNNWYLVSNETKIELDKNDFSAALNGEKINFDCCYITIHGIPGEDGKLQGYFDMIGMPYISSNQFNSALTFNKFRCNQLLKELGHIVSKAILIASPEAIDEELIAQEIGFPCFVKPNDGGSSIGVFKVMDINDLASSIIKSFEFGNQIIVESFVDGTEVSSGVFSLNNELHVLPLTELISENEFFDYEAKYEGESQEITPARISDELTDLIQQTTGDIYEELGLSGISRVDYIIQDNIPHIIEINTIPGMSDKSIIPQQLDEAGLVLGDIVKGLIEEVMEMKTNLIS